MVMHGARSCACAALVLLGSIPLLAGTGAGTHPWTLEVAGEYPYALGDGIWGISLALNPQGAVGVAYSVYQTAELHYAVRDGTGWTTEVVASQTGSPPSLKFDSLGRPHIAVYALGGSGSLGYGKKVSGTWSLEVVDTGFVCGRFASLVLDSQDRPRIAYNCIDDARMEWLRYAAWNGFRWNIETLDRGGMHGTSLALDGADRPHIAYLNVSRGELDYVFFDGNAWNYEAASPAVIDNSPEAGPSLAVDPSGGVHIAFGDGTFPSRFLKYAFRDGSGWSAETVDTLPRVLSASLALDPDGQPRIAYQRMSPPAGPEGTLLYAWKTGGWRTETVDQDLSDDHTGAWASLAIDRSGRPHLSYFRGSRLGVGRVWYATTAPAPDYAPEDPQPPSPLAVAPSSQVLLSVNVANRGSATNATTTLAFHNASTPSAPFAAFAVPPLGAGNASGPYAATWIAPAVPGTYAVVASVDADDVLPESSEANNLHAWVINVLLPPTSDLAVLLVILDPPSPLPDGTLARVDATVGNGGELPAGGFDVLVFDDANANGLPDGGEGVGSVPLPGLEGGAQGNVAVPWTASPPGIHRLCVYADPPPGTVSEADETNNVACVDALVVPGPVTRPDYIPVSPQPASPVRAGLSLPVPLSVEVENRGNAAASATATIAFFNASAPATPFAAFAIAPLAPSETSVRFAAAWTAPATPGTYDVVADVDFGDDLAEWDEANNRFTWTIDVLAGPITTLVVGTPNVTAIETYVTSATLLSFAVLDPSGAGIRNTTVRVDGGPWVNYTATGSFTLAGEGRHLVEWSSEDFAGNVEAVANATLVVDDTPPTVSPDLGTPRFEGAATYVTSATPLTITAADGGAVPVGIASVEYRLGGAWIPTAGAFTLAGPDGPRTVEYRAADLLGNVATGQLAVVVDDTPPVTTPSRGDGTYPMGTAFAFSATDAGSGVARTEVRVDGDAWTAYATPLVLAEGAHTIRFRSVDRLGNAEPERLLSVTITGTPVWGLPPVADLVATPASAEVGTPIAFDGSASSDPDGTIVDFAFAFGDGTAANGTAAARNHAYAAPGRYTITLTVTDDDGNTSTAHATVEITTTSAPSPETNWKPLVAAVFASVLAIVGAWSARRAPWPRGSRPRLRAFVLAALPFVALEAATGVASLLTGALAIPPLLGAGTAVDVGILIAGIAFVAYRVARRAPST